VRVRGLGIVLEKISIRLVRYPDVSQTEVVVREAPVAASLIAYVVPRGGADVDAAALRDTLAAELPDHMVSAAIVALDTMVLTPNGKLDRAEA
jgi:acyl-CoA synthetase (AMP-forming)/AMP-acid ligase II